MSRKFKEGDRVKSEFLGEGVVLDPRPCPPLTLVRVRFDVDPPYAYNCSQNPTVDFEHALEKVKP